MIKEEKLPSYRIDKFLEMLASVGIDLDACKIRTSNVEKVTYVYMKDFLIAKYSEESGTGVWNTAASRVKGTRSVKPAIGDYEPLCLRKENES